jgi:hypothetical protein
MEGKSNSLTLVMLLMLSPIFALVGYKVYEYCNSITKVVIIHKK